MKTTHTPTPEIVRRDRFMVLGVRARIEPGTESSELFATIWRRFEAQRAAVEAHSTDGCYYGVSFPRSEDDSFEYLAAMAVDPSAPRPHALECREIPAARYAVFACAVAAIGDTYGRIFGEWRTTCGFMLDSSTPAFEQYPPARFPDEPVRIHIPVTEDPIP